MYTHTHTHTHTRTHTYASQPYSLQHTHTQVYASTTSTYIPTYIPANAHSLYLNIAMLNLDKRIEAIEVMHSITVKQQNPYWHLKKYN